MTLETLKMFIMSENPNNNLHSVTTNLWNDKHIKA